MKKIYSLSLVALMVLSVLPIVLALNPAADNGLTKGKSIVNHLYLFEKDANWDIVEGGAWGKMMYKEDKFVFNGHMLIEGVSYTLVNYCGWPNVQIMGTAVADMYGDVHITGVMPETLCIEDENAGAKIWLVETSDLTGTAFNSWTPTEYLFEYDLI